MKVYVDDLLVKNCSCCDFCYTNSQGGVCKLTGHLTRYDEPLEEMRNKCPLQSLAEHDKQVRKQVCERLDKIITKYICNRSRNDIRITDISSIIKQVQGETK